MAQFSYKARGNRGDSITGTMESRDVNTVASTLLQGGLTPVSITPIKAVATPFDLSKLLPSEVTEIELLQFCRQMHSLVRAGVPLLGAMGGLVKNCRSRAFSEALQNVLQALEGGKDLASSMAQQSKVFSEYFTSLVRIGESSGQLSEIFLQLSRYMERDRLIKEKIKKSLRYPMIVSVTIVIAIVIINVMVIPAFADMFKRYDATLPLVTRILIATSDFTTNHWGVVIAGVIGIAAGIHVYLKIEEGRYLWDKWKLQIPLIGIILYRMTLARFLRLFALSSKSGVPMLSGLTLVAKAMKNAYLEERVLAMREGIERGESLSRTATSAGIFDPIALQMIHVGEQTGQVDELLLEVAEYYEQEAAYDSDRLSSAIEPIMTILIAIVVMIVALGVLLPWWDMAGAAFGQ